jgi:hypothetical protein
VARERPSARETRFRENEVLRAFAADEAFEGPFGFQCECDRDCRELVIVDRFDVSALRANPGRLVVSPGHPTEEAGVVLKRDGYVVVELLAFSVVNRR